MPKSKSDVVRQHVFDKYVSEARKHHVLAVTVRAGDVAKALNLRRRMPLVCGALGTDKFQNEFGVKLIQRSGPGNGSNATFTYQV